MKFYTYLYLREDGTPSYVGKGKGRRVFARHRKHSVPPKDRIILQEFENEADAIRAEMFLIAYYGRIDLGTGCLRNLTDGGEGSTGWKPPKAWREALSQRLKGNKHTLGFRHSDESRRKMSESRKGQKHWWGYKTAAKLLSLPRRKGYTRTFTPEWRRNLSLAQYRRYARLKDTPVAS